MWKKEIKEKARVLRREGSMYPEICRELGVRIPKSTLSGWCRGIKLSKEAKETYRKLELKRLAKARKKAVQANREKREAWLNDIRESNVHLVEVMQDDDAAKIALVMLYLGEGFKTRRGAAGFGNSDPKIIGLYMKLLRQCYEIDEKKFRCTVQCRSDQNIPKLERYWSEVTKIPLSRFYAARIDPRSLGKKTERTHYKGVCVIDYFSSFVFNDILQAANLLCEGR